MCPNIEHGEIAQVFQQWRNDARRDAGCRNGTHLHIGTPSTTTRIRFILFCPFLDNDIAGDSLLDIVPAQSQPLPELRIEAVPVVEEIVQIAAIMSATGIHPGLGGKLGQVEGVRNVC